MKSVNYLLAICGVLLLLVFPSCSDDDEDVVTVDDAAGLGSLDEETTSLLRDNILAREQGTEDVAPIALLLARGVSSDGSKVHPPFPGEAFSFIFFIFSGEF